MTFLVLATITAFFSFPQISVSETSSADQPAIEAQAPVPEILQKIGECESRTGHYDSDGNVVIGKQNKYDTGKYQINTLYWTELAEKLGIDLFTEEGNEAMALVLYERYGTDPWNSSKKCWGNS